MKYIHLITSLEMGGTETFLIQLLEHSPSNHSHEVWYFKKAGVAAEAIRRLGVPIRQISSPVQLWKALRAEKPEVLHTCLYRAHQIGRFVGRLAGVPKIISSQQSIDSWQTWPFALLDRFTLLFCDLVFVNSLAAKRLVTSRFGPFHRPVVQELYNALDPDFAGIDRQKARDVYQLPKGAIVGGTLMRLHHEKGADRIPAFADRLLTRYPHLHLFVGGVGPLELQLKAETANRSWASRLHWMGWIEDKRTFLSAFDFFWLLSREESYPQCLLEAAVVGCPWLATSVGDIPLMQKEFPAALTIEWEGEWNASFDAWFKKLPELQQQAKQLSPVIHARYSLAHMVQSFYFL